MDAATLRRVAMNIFPPAWANLGDPSQFPWHTTTDGGCDADRRHSSQAPAVDFFGMLIKAKDRDAVLDRLAAELGLWATAKAADPPESSREVRCLIWKALDLGQVRRHIGIRLIGILKPLALGHRRCEAPE